MSEQSNSANNRRIAKNTIFMYFRMFITMAVGLYTSRVVLRTLGADDYGLYNVVGGIIAMFGFLNGAMSNTTSRYITFYLGRNDKKMLTNIFSMAFIIHACIAAIIVVLGETVGLWYLYEKLVIPDGRFTAALWLYQLSIASTVLAILYVPFNAAIIAHERMSAFAYISILDAVLKLLIVFALVWAPYDKLIFYGTLIFCVQVMNIIIYFTYCRKRFEETKLCWYWDRSVFKEMFGFAGWSLLGNFSYLFFTQGINLIINAFCGTAVNAARAVAVQVEGVVRQFATSVQTAINPQIIKSYADNNIDRMYSLIFTSSRYCFYLLFLLSVPIMIEAEYILKLWLVNPPAHTVAFLRLTLIHVMMDGMVNPLFTANLASGKVKIYHIVISIISYSFMPITYFAIKLTNVPESVFVCIIVSAVIGLVARLFIVRNQIGLSIRLYMRKVLGPNALVCALSCIAPVAVFCFMPHNFLGFFVTCAVSVISVLGCVYVFGADASEREFVKGKAIQFIEKRHGA